MMGDVNAARPLAALALTSLIALTGCSGVGSDMGATIEGTTFSVAELQEAAVQLGTVDPQLNDPRQIIASLSLLPLVDDIFRGTAVEVTAAQTLDLLGQMGLEDPAPTTQEATRFLMYQAIVNDPNTFADPAMAEAAEKLANLDAAFAELDVEVNPRFGDWDAAKGGLIANVPSWIESASVNG